MSLSLADMPAAVDLTRRDGHGRYLIVPPGGGKPEGYTRVTTVAGTLDDGGGLSSWKATMTVVGTMLRKGILAQWEALIATADGDPWYHSQATKTAAKRLVEEASAFGGANDRRDIGTSMHTITALADTGSDVKHLSPETQRDLDAYLAGMAEAGVTVCNGAVELTVVLDDHHVAGTFDRLCMVPGFDLPLIADLKTGADLSYSWQSIAVQLAAYSRADAIYFQGAADDGSQDVRSPMPEVDQHVGLIMWLNAGTGLLELHLVDLDLGWPAFLLSMAVRQWRSERSIATPLSEYVAPTRDDDLIDALAASVAAIDVDHAANLADVRQWLSDRIKVCGAHEGARAALAATWPAGMPFLHRSDEHTPDDLVVIETVIASVERRFALPFPENVAAMAGLIRAFKGATIEDDDDA